MKGISFIMKALLGITTGFVCAIHLGGGAWAASFPPKEMGVPAQLQEVGIDGKPGARVAIQEIQLVDEQNQKTPLSKYFASGRPVLLALVYYECPNLCTMVLNGLVDSLKTLDWNPGEKFEIVAVSINPSEKSEIAAQKKASYVQASGKVGTDAGWHFLTGSEDQIRKLASQVGFGYKYVPEEKQYAHAAGLFVLTPDGTLSRILYGIQYQARDMRLALLEASNGKIGNIVDRALLFCYRYNEAEKKYSLVSTRIMKAGSAGMLLFFGGYLAIFWMRQRKGGSKTV